MQHIVVGYDIVDDKSRRIVGEVLEGFGRRVNRSVFEIELKNSKTRQKLEDALAQEIDPHVDSIRLYTICAKCMQTSRVLGKEPDAFDEDAIYFF